MRSPLVPAILVGLAAFPGFGGSCAAAPLAGVKSAPKHSFFLEIRNSAGREIGSQSSGAGAGKMSILSFNSGAIQPEERDGSRAASGKRHWQPVVVMRKVDRASPTLRSLQNNGRLEVMITAVEDTATGQHKPIYEIKLTNAILSRYSLSSGSDNPTESLSFTFQKITWTYTNGGKSFQDDWSK